MTGVINDQGVWFFLDTHVQCDPTAEQIAEATLQATFRLKLFGIEPKVALLSHSNFGSHDNAVGGEDAQGAARSSSSACPKLEVDGEMQADTAWDEELRHRIFPNTLLKGRANLFVMPNLDAANITYNMVRVMTDGVAIGPILMGLRQARARPDAGVDAAPRGQHDGDRGGGCADPRVSESGRLGRRTPLPGRYAACPSPARGEGSQGPVIPAKAGIHGRCPCARHSRAGGNPATSPLIHVIPAFARMPVLNLPTPTPPSPPFPPPARSTARCPR